MTERETTQSSVYSRVVKRQFNLNHLSNREKMEVERQIADEERQSKRGDD